MRLKRASRGAAGMWRVLRAHKQEMTRIAYTACTSYEIHRFVAVRMAQHDICIKTALAAPILRVKRAELSTMARWNAHNASKRAV